MRWIKVTKNNLPSEDEEVLVWVKYEGDTEFTVNLSMLDNDNSIYIEPNSGRGWIMGSAKNYEITHFAILTKPINRIRRKLTAKKLVEIQHAF